MLRLIAIFTLLSIPISFYFGYDEEAFKGILILLAISAWIGLLNKIGYERAKANHRSAFIKKWK